MAIAINPSDLINQTVRRMRFALYAGILMVLMISLHKLDNKVENALAIFFSRFGCGLLIGGASLCAGGFLGFIFGIPNLLQSQVTNESKSSMLKYNDNLVQISDWLTKIIVGVSLTQINSISDKVLNLGDHLKENFGEDKWGMNASLAIVFYFFLFGFLMIYFWTRTDFTRIMKEVDDDLQVKFDNLQQKYQQTEEKKLMFEKWADSEVSNIAKAVVEQSPFASDAIKIDAFKENNSDKLKSAIGQLKDKVNEVLKTKPVIVKDDLQKGRWGGKKENNGKAINAKVSPSKTKNFYDIAINVTDKNKSLDVPVAIFVHDSFELPDDVIYLVPDENGVAQITLTAYEAFTVGALFADGTELELDLNDQPGYPDGFYWKTFSQSSLS